MGLFVEGNYDVKEFFIPSDGMNQNISPKLLPGNFAYVLENVIPIPKGSGMIRYGTNLINSGLAVDSKIIEGFPFLTTTGDEQIILYVQDFIQDMTVGSETVLSPNSFSFTTTHPTNYELNTDIKIRYQDATIVTYLYNNIDSIVVAGNLVTITLDVNSFSGNIGDITILDIYYSDANIYYYDLNTSTLSGILLGNLTVGTVPRSVTFQNILVICNGVDPIMSWDGTNLAVIKDYVQESAQAFNRIDNTHFSFTIGANFIQAKYQAGTSIKLSVNGVITNLTVASIVVVAQIATITTNQNIPNFAGQDVILLSYADTPPSFSFLFAAHDRLWALGAGAVGLEYRDQDQAMIVYYANQENSITNWFDERTKLVPNIDLSSKHGIPDNLEAICFVKSYMAFIGRHKTQLWQGIDPTANASPATAFVWAYNIPVGIIHGNLLIEVSNQAFIVTSNGLFSFSTYNIAQQAVATSFDAIDPLIRQYVETITISDVDYRACRSFKYTSGPFCGFKIGRNKLLVSLVSTDLYAWMFFTGDFQNATSFVTGGNQSLYLLVGNTIYQYGDGKGGTISYADQGGNAAISYYITWPVLHMKGIRFANKRYEIQMNYSSSFVVNTENTINIAISGDTRKTFSVENEYLIDNKGDLFNTILMLSHSLDPNLPSFTSKGMRLDIPYEYPKGRLKFISSSFWLAIFGRAFDGPVFFDRVRLFGINERSS